MRDFDDFGEPSRRVRSVGDRRRFAAELAAAYAVEHGPLAPVTANGRGIARSFWGRAWCRKLEEYQEYESRLPAGRSYLKNGAVIDLRISLGQIQAAVAGEELYQLSIQIAPLSEERRNALLGACAGKIGSLVDLLEGRLSEELLAELTAPERGLFPETSEISFRCNCLDWADLCTHAAAALYGVGARLDTAPELLFTLRGIDSAALLADALPTALRQNAPVAAAPSQSLADTFGIELDDF